MLIGDTAQNVKEGLDKRDLFVTSDRKTTFPLLRRSPNALPHGSKTSTGILRGDNRLQGRLNRYHRRVPALLCILRTTIGSMPDFGGLVADLHAVVALKIMIPSGGFPLVSRKAAGYTSRSRDGIALPAGLSRHGLFHARTVSSYGTFLGGRPVRTPARGARTPEPGTPSGNPRSARQRATWARRAVSTHAAQV